MPIIVIPGATPPPAPTTLTSADGVLTVTTDSGGVKLKVDWTTLTKINAETFTTNVAAWAVYGTGGTFTWDAGSGGQAKIVTTAATAAIGGTWTLPTPMPGNQATHWSFTWTSTATLVAGAWVVDLLDTLGNVVSTSRYAIPAGRNRGKFQGRILANKSTATVTKARVYLATGVGSGQTVYLDTVTIRTAKITHTRFYRDGQPVRGGNPRRTPSGIGFGYDDEVPFNVASSWKAEGYDRLGDLVTTSQQVALVLTMDTSSWRSVWLKSLSDPNKDMQLIAVHPLPKVTLPARGSLTDTNTSQYPVGPTGVRGSQKIEPLTIFTDTMAEARALENLLSGGDVLFLQFLPNMMTRPNVYVRVGDVSYEAAGTQDDESRVWTLPLTQVRRPTTVDSSTYRPGHSFADSRAVAATFADRKITWPTFANVQGG